MKTMEQYILDAIPYPIMYVDVDHIIRYMNKKAEFYFYEVRGYRDLIGKNLLDCHDENIQKMIIRSVEKLKAHGSEIYLGVTTDNLRKYINPVRDENGELIGYFERFELNQEK